MPYLNEYKINKDLNGSALSRQTYAEPFLVLQLLQDKCI